MQLAEACEREVVTLHEFFEDWFAGRIEKDDDAFDRVRDALGDEFEMVAPSGRTVGRESVITGIWDVYGRDAGSDAHEIRVEELRVRHVREDLCLVSYEEWQRGAAEETGRQSSALFQRAEATPNGIEWLHLHETWLPGAAPEEN
jgi:hypothetical protein